MKRKTWNCDENRQLYKDYYRNQLGGIAVMPVFARRHYQDGLGSPRRSAASFNAS